MSFDRMALARRYRARNLAGETYQQLVDDHNRRYPPLNGDTPKTRGFIARLFTDLKNRDNPAPAPDNILELDNWRGIESRNASGEWQDVLNKLERDNRYLIVEHDNDNHFPYQDNDAQRMRSVCRQLVQPDIIAVGSDAIDAPGLSKYEEDKRLPAGRTLSRFRPHWIYHVQNRLTYDAPDAQIAWINGNHDERVWNYLESDDSYDILYQYHVDTITQDGVVHFLGTGASGLSFTVAGILMVTHGTKATVHTANGMLREYDNQFSILAGHSHRPDYYTTKSRYMVSCTIGGCGCGLRPAYEKRKVYTKWQHGYSYGIVNTRTKQAVTKHIPFVHTDTHIWAVLDTEVVSIKKQQVNSIRLDSVA